MADDDRLWQWPNHIVMSPTSLKTFRDCPSRVKMHYLQGLEAPDKWIQFYALGNATHSALGTIAQQLGTGTQPIGEEQIRILCGVHMPLNQYPSVEAREYDVRKVLEWVRRGRAWLETLDVQEWLLVEKKQRRDIGLFPIKARYELLAKPDLILKRQTDEGEPYFQIVDWKTGQVREEPDVPVIHRYTLREKLSEWVGNPSTANVTFTWYWLEDNDRKDVDVSVEHCNHAWPGILEQMEAMATETEWRATPGWYCRYCPYYQNHCPEEMPPDDR